MDDRSTVIRYIQEQEKMKRERKAFWRNVTIAGALLVVAVIFTLSVGCSETTVQPCCNDGCIDIHTPASNPACVKKEPGGGSDDLKTFIYICKNGKQKRIYEFNWPDWKKKGWKKGKCQPTPPPPPPPGDDDDDDGEEKVCLCHIPPGNPSNAHTICVGEPAVPAHLAHGDYLGECK